MRDFKKLHVWQKAHQMTLMIYHLTADFPASELYGLRSQIRRSSASIGANIAEGCGRNGRKELTRFLNIAMGSASELEYHLLLANDLEFIPHDKYAILNAQVIEVKRMLAGFIKTLKADG